MVAIDKDQLISGRETTDRDQLALTVIINWSEAMQKIINSFFVNKFMVSVAIFREK